jgi:AcrR family transcriptional regulator
MDKMASRNSSQRSQWPKWLTHVVWTKKLSTKSLLIDTGEKLFGQHGFDGISLREIAVAAGQANSNVVQYHFTNKNGLIMAISEDPARPLPSGRSLDVCAAPNGPEHHVSIVSDRTRFCTSER